MDAFEPLPLDAFQREWQQMWDQMRPINPGMSDDDLKRFIDSQIAAGRSEEKQYLNAFMEPFAAEAVAITVLSHALVEATINTALALALAHVGRPDLFVIIEQASVKHKWTIGPQSFLSNYAFPKSDALFEGLSTLCRSRNAYAHSKITLRDESSQVLLPGLTGVGLSIDQGARKLLHRFLSLPYELHQHLLRQIDCTCSCDSRSNTSSRLIWRVRSGHSVKTAAQIANDAKLRLQQDIVRMLRAGGKGARHATWRNVELDKRLWNELGTYDLAELGATIPPE